MEKNITYIVRLKKEDYSYLNDINDLEEIKKILQNHMGLNINNKKIKTSNTIDIMNVDKKKIGLKKKNKKVQLCNICNDFININTFMKVLDCNHNFHIKCVETYFNSHIFLECPICKHEHITSHI